MKRIIAFLLALAAFALLTQTALGATSTFYPDAGTGGTTVDGIVGRDNVNETWSTIRSGAGNYSWATGGNDYTVRLKASTTTDQYDKLWRSIFTFDTSSMSGDVASAATFSLYGGAKGNGLGSFDMDIVASTPASDNALVNSDYGQVGTTSFGTLTYSSFTNEVYNDITLDANGIANISVSGVSKFGAINSWDQSGTFGGTWASGAQTFLLTYFADNAGTTKDPKLVVTHAPAPFSNHRLTIIQ